MRIINYFIIIVLFISILSCESSNKTENSEPSQDEILSKQLMLNTIRHDVEFNWDTINYIYSASYEDILKTRNHIVTTSYMGIGWDVTDIYIKDGKYYIKFLKDVLDYPAVDFSFDFEATKEQAEKILKYDDGDGRSFAKAVFVFQPKSDSFRKLDVMLDAEDAYNQISVGVEITDDNVFFLEARLVDLIIIEDRI